MLLYSDNILALQTKHFVIDEIKHTVTVSTKERQEAALYISFENHVVLCLEKWRSVHQYSGLVFIQSDINLWQHVTFLLFPVTGHEQVLHCKIELRTPGTKLHKIVLNFINWAI